MECDRTLGLRRKGQALEWIGVGREFDYGALETYCDPIDGRGNGTKFEKNSKNARDNNNLTIIFLLFFFRFVPFLFHLLYRNTACGYFTIITSCATTEQKGSFFLFTTQYKLAR